MKNFFNILIWEIGKFFKDEGLILFCVILPLAYPIVYSWIYNNEVVREVPVVVVDMDNSTESREFIRLYDASPNAEVAFKANSIDEARKYVDHCDAYGIIYIPEDFSRDLNRLQQATVSVYCDMKLMLAYKNVYQTATAVQQIMGKQVQAKLMGRTTKREAEISAAPMKVDEISIFNTPGGYGNFVLPGVLILIIQQTLLLGIGLSWGTNKERYGRMLPDRPIYQETSVFGILSAKATALFILYLGVSSYVLLLVPKMFSFVSILYTWDYVCFLVPFLLACIFFAFCAMSLVPQREDVMLLVVFSSVLLLFMGGVSWPSSAIPVVWKYVSYIFPSTFGIKAFIRMNSMGARIEDIRPELICLWVQFLVYFFIAMLIYYRDKGRETKKSKNMRFRTPKVLKNIINI